MSCETMFYSNLKLLHLNLSELSLGRGMGRRFKREETNVYLWLIMLMFDRRQQNSVKQLSFNLKINKFLKKDDKRKNSSVFNLTLRL